MADMEPLSKFAQPTRIETPNWFNTIVGWVDGESTTGVNEDYVTGNAAPAFPTQPQPQGNPYVQSSSNQPQPHVNDSASGSGNWMPQGQGQAPQQQTVPQASAPFQQASTSNQPSGLTTANGQSPFGGGQQTLPGGNGQSNQAASSGNDDLDAQLNAILGN